MAAVLGMVVALALVLGGLPRSAAAAATIYVNGVTGQDSNDGTAANPYRTIQKAVNEAAAGDTIEVAAATYDEQVTIAKSLTLVGAGPATTIIKAPSNLPAANYDHDSNPATDPVPNPSSYIMKIAGAGVSVDMSGFTVSGPGPSACGSIGLGILVRDGAHANIHDNKIIDVRDTGLSGCQNGNAIMVGRQYWGTTGTADITNNVINGYQKTGIIVDNVGSQADIQGNTITGDGPIAYIAENGIQIGRGASANITNNIVSGHSYTGPTWSSAGILIFSAGQTNLTGNQVTNNQVGISLSDTSSVITGNKVNASETGTGVPNFWGIFLYNAATAPMIVDLTGNTFSSNNAAGGYAIDLGAGWGTHPIDLEVSGNVISNWGHGVVFECNTTCGAGFSPLTFTNNSIIGNNNGVENTMGVMVIAENNWWGDATGPSGVALGSGDSVSVDVDYTPWLEANPQPTQVNLTSTDQLVCGTNSASLTVDLSNVPNLYGYQIEVTYDDTKVDATGAFVNSWFNTAGALVPGGWDGTCGSGSCKFAVSRQSPAPPTGGGGPVATINFTSQTPGTFNAEITTTGPNAAILTDIDGFQIPFTSDDASMTFNVCGQATVSGKVELQGRLTPMDAGQVKLIDQGGNFTTPIVVPFNATTGAFSANVPVMPNGSDYLMQATHILYVGTQKTLTDLDAGDALINQNTRLWGGDANNSGLSSSTGIDVSDIACISGAFGGGPAGCTDPQGSTDINKDLVTNIQDLALAGGNYGKNPYQPW
jgi:parallel beta-helix repeat protein